MLERLIAFDTTSRNSNLALIEFVEDYLSQLGITSERVSNSDGTKANLYATLGPDDSGGYLLSGHTDVVPVDGQAWDSDPFEVTSKGSRLYGRGTSDMKSFVAVCLALAPEYLAKPRRVPLHFAFSYDEEVGCIGVRGLIQELAARPIKPIACIVGEPTEMKVIRGHKGKQSTRCLVQGREAHSSLTHLGVNAVEYAAELVSFIRDIAHEHRDNGPYDEAYEPAYTSIHVGTMQGGTALNIVPLSCQFEFEFRHLPEVSPDDLLERITSFARDTLEPQMKALDPNAGFRFESISRIPGLTAAEDSEIVQLAMRLTGRNDTGKVAFGTEAGLFQEHAGIPTVICGPGSIEQAHKPNEFIELEQIARCEAFLRGLFERCE